LSPPKAARSGLDTASTLLCSGGIGTKRVLQHALAGGGHAWRATGLDQRSTATNVAVRIGKDGKKAFNWSKRDSCKTWHPGHPPGPKQTNTNPSVFSASSRYARPMLAIRRPLTRAAASGQGQRSNSEGKRQPPIQTALQKKGPVSSFATPRGELGGPPIRPGRL
jgi:hypothetical protein